MNNEGEVLDVQDSVKLAQGGVQVDLVEGGVGNLLNWIVRHHFSLQHTLSKGLYMYIRVSLY